MVGAVLNILEHCPNYDKIVTYSYQRTDLISKNLINSYKDYIRSMETMEESADEVNRVDQIVGLYVTDIHFYDFVQENYYSDNLPYYLDFKDELDRLKMAYELLGAGHEQTKWL